MTALDTTIRDTISEAVEAIRAEWSGPVVGTAWNGVRDFHLAVADWLDWCARYDKFNSRALAVARAYLGPTS